LFEGLQEQPSSEQVQQHTMTSKSALELVVQLRTLAADPNNRPHMIPPGDYVPPGLLMFLDHPSSDVVFNALETIYFLSLYPPNRTQMIKNEYLLPKVKALMSNGKTGEIKRKAIATFTSLKKATTATVRGAPEELADMAAAKPAQPLSSSSENVNINNSSTTAATKSARAMPSFGFEGARTAAAVTVTVYMKELSTEAKKAEFESKMVNHRGVVSFWVDLNQHKAVVRTTLSDDALIKAITAQLGWIASTDSSFVSPSNSGYIEEQQVGEGAIVYRNKQSKKAKESSGGGGWFSSVTSYIW